MSLIDRYDAFLLDLDGVLYRGDDAIQGADAGVAALRERGRVLFVTNNSAPTPDTISRKLAGFGIDVPVEDVVTSAQAAVPLLHRLVGEGGTVFVVGEEGVKVALEEGGMKLADPGTDTADAVVVGWDRTADYEKLRRASILVQRGARLVATNTDASYPAPGGVLWPGTGALLAAIETTTGVRAEVAGKPHPALYELALERAGTRNALVVGDRVDTDVAGAVGLGLDAVLVLSGVGTTAELLERDGLPVAVLDSLRDLATEPRLVVIREAEPGDGGDILALVAGAGLQDLPGDSLQFMDGDSVGTAAIRVRGEEAYLHSVAIAREVRGQRIGTLLSAGAVRAAVARGARTCYLVTEEAEGFFAGLGFERIERDSLPEWIVPLATECSTRAASMRRELAQ